MITKDILNFIAGFAYDPVGFVFAMYPWGEGELENQTPQDWQISLLEDIKNGLRTIDEVIRIATASGHGIGKSALVCWLIEYALYTKANTRVVVTANTDGQLRTKTWAELAKWHRLNIASEMFIYTATSLYSANKGSEKTWRADAIPWNKSNPAAFAGLHNKGNRILLVFDEASEIDDTIWEVAEGAMTDADTEIIWAVFGNPTRNIGRFSECFGKEKGRWVRRKIDSRTVPITNKNLLNSWVETYGLESDFVKVRVLGEFPSASELQFIGRNIVDEASKRILVPSDYGFAPAIIGVDPAWSGKDSAVIYLRKGNYSKKLYSEPKSDDNYAFAEKVAMFEDKYNAASVNIDFGYGQGIYSAGKTMGRVWHLIPFMSTHTTDPTLFNKRIEMWKNMKDWLIEGGALDQMDNEIQEELIMPEAFIGLNGKLMLQRKEDMAYSPNNADALALTFARNIKQETRESLRKKREIKNYNPLQRL